jgi:glycosyltransferase involved in cell wall biosynthesis
MDTKAEVSNRKIAFNISPDVITMLRLHRVVVVIPAYNEERFIGSVILKMMQFPLTVIVVDDGSTDHTAFVADAAGALVVRHAENKGKGVALNTGICEARQMDPDVIVVIDGDGQHLVRELPSLVRPILEEGADIVVGSRYLEKTSDVPTNRLLGHWFFNKLTSLASRVTVTDSQSGYRAFSPKAFNSDLFLSRDFSVESEMQFLAHEHALRLVEVPITIRYTDAPKRPILAQGMTVLGGIIKLTGQYRPLLYFSLPGTVLMLAGLGIGLLVIELYSHRGELAVGYAMLGVLLTVIGMVAYSTGVILHSIRGLLTDLLHRNVYSKGNHAR